MRDHATGGRAGGTPSSKSPRGTPSSSDSKGKWYASPSPGVTPGGSSKKTRLSLFGNSPSSSAKPPSGPLPPPLSRTTEGVPQNFPVPIQTACILINP
ncbi:UNVERIFIED_CONTAM: hypothetical protein Slati_3720100 [Sesamum latifolium]|uniref:Uncharacterized protein n=1 Tax=Sesamum latifolium TaxID=2727402 RepID=A0AAW2U396_9LAMI